MCAWQKLRSSIVGEASIHQGWTLAALLLATACSAPQPSALQRPLPAPIPTAAAPAFVTDPPEQALPALVMAERQASIAGDLATLAQLWAADARIVDGRGTPDPDDDYVWSGRAALLDRYRLAVFPSPPPPLAESDLLNAQLSLQDDQATLQRNGDHWRFVRRDGRWWLLELVYN